MCGCRIPSAQGQAYDSNVNPYEPLPDSETETEQVPTKPANWSPVEIVLFWICFVLLGVLLLNP